ncbi:MAG TPA: sugar-binding protein [Anaerolineales bacterium]|nr:sugar-binding protein [Anaerolineales bacterium]
MNTRAIVFPLVVVMAAALACTLPGAAPPTPFAFPTPNQTLTAIFAPTAGATVAAPTAAATSTIAVTAIVTSASLPTSTSGALSSRPNGSPVAAAHLSTPPTIDGDLADWATATYSVSQVTYGAARWSGLNDASGVFYIGWDSSALYIAARVTDDQYVQISSGHDMYLGDSLEIQLDANLASDFYTVSLSSDDYQIGLSAGNFGSISPQAYRWYPSDKAGVPSGVTVGGKSTTSGYTLEAKIPWTVFGVTPAEGSRYGFTLSVSDNDSAGAAAQQSMVSSVSTRELFDPTSWGTLVLGE